MKRDVLLIPLVGPMQSWGTRSRFQERDTERDPSKSGVIGLLCAAMGRDRSAPLDDLMALKMAVRADREGYLRKDFQTALNVITADGKVSKDAQVSRRFYLSDAAFLVGLAGDGSLLDGIHNALANPVWPLFLGRKSYVPSLPLYLKDGIFRETSLRETLLTYPLLCEPKKQNCVRIVHESSTMTHESRMDIPMSFALGRREFRERFVRTEFISTENFSFKEDEDVSLTT
jgi:CRISPR system Cascade subunit CasD